MSEAIFQVSLAYETETEKMISCLTLNVLYYTTPHHTTPHHTTPTSAPNGKMHATAITLRGVTVVETKGNFESGQNRTKACFYILEDRDMPHFVRYHGHKL